MISAAAVNRFQKSTAEQAGEQATGGAVSIDGRSYTVAVVPARGVLELSSGGYVQARTLEIIAREEILPLKVLVDKDSGSEPIRRIVVTHAGIDYMVKNVVTDATGYQHHITCVEKDALK